MPTGAAGTLQGPIAGFAWDVPVDLSKKEVQARLSPSAIKGFFKLMRSWKLRDEDARQLLGGSLMAPSIISRGAKPRSSIRTSSREFP